MPFLHQAVYPETSLGAVGKDMVWTRIDVDFDEEKSGIVQ